MIYLSLSNDIPGIISGGVSDSLGASGFSASFDLTFPSGFFSRSLSPEVFEIVPVYVSISVSIPSAFSPFAGPGCEVFEPEPDFFTFSVSVPDILSAGSPAVDYSPAVPIPFEGVLALPDLFPAPVFSFEYEPPPADYYALVDASLSLLDNFSAPVVSVDVIAPVSGLVSDVLPGSGVSDFFDVSLNSEFTELFPWVPVSLPGDFFNIPPAVSSVLSYSPTPAGAVVPLPAGFFLDEVSALVVPPVPVSLSLALPDFSGFSAAVSSSVYVCAYLSLSRSMPSFFPEILPVCAVSPDIIFISDSCPLPSFSSFLGSPRVRIIPGIDLALSSSLPGLDFLSFFSCGFGPGGFSISFPGNFFSHPPQTVLFIPDVLPPIFWEEALSFPSSFFFSPAAFDFAVWKVGIESFLLMVSGKKY